MIQMTPPDSDPESRMDSEFRHQEYLSEICPLDDPELDDDLLDCPFTIDKSSDTKIDDYFRKFDQTIEQVDANVFDDTVKASRDCLEELNFTEYSVYNYCPVCRGWKSITIEHIKKCATKNSIEIRGLIAEVKKIPFSVIRKYKTINPKAKNSKKTKKHNAEQTSEYDLVVMDDTQKEAMVNKYISRLEIRNNQIDPTEESFSDLPFIWTASFLTIDSKLYILDDFQMN